RYNYLLAGIPPENPDDIVDIELYGLGKESTLREFEDFCGLDFTTKTASAKALQAGFIDNIDHYRKSSSSSPMSAGDRLPSFSLLDSAGKKHLAQTLADAKPCLFCVLPSDFAEYMRDFFALYRFREKEIAALGVHIVFVAPVAMNKLKSFQRHYNIPRAVMADETNAMLHAFGIAGSFHEMPLTVGVNANMEITGVYMNRNAENHINDILREVRNLGGPKDGAVQSS